MAVRKLLKWWCDEDILVSLLLGKALAFFLKWLMLQESDSIYDFLDYAWKWAS